jgi:hypothetical protein
MASTVTKVLPKAHPPVTTVEKAPKSKTVVAVAAPSTVLTAKPAYAPTAVTPAQTARALPGSQNVNAAQVGKANMAGGANGNNGTSATGTASYVTYY